MCGGHCSCCEGSCVRLLSGAEHDVMVRGPLRMSFSPRQPLGEIAKVLGIGD